MSNGIQPLASNLTSVTGIAVAEESRSAGNGLSSRLCASHQACGTILRPLGSHLALLESGVPLEQIPALHAQASTPPELANMPPEWLTHLGVQAVQYLLAYGLNHWAPLTLLLQQALAGRLKPQTVDGDSRSAGSTSPDVARSTKLAQDLNGAIEFVLVPFVVWSGGSSLAALSLPAIPAHLLFATLSFYTQQWINSQLRGFAGEPKQESTHFLLEMIRLGANCVSLGHYAPPVINSLNSWLSPEPEPRLRIAWDQRKASPEVQARWREDRRLTETDQSSAGKLERALVHVNNPQTRPGESALTSSAGRPVSLLQSVPKALGAFVGWLQSSPPPALHDNDVESPLYLPQTDAVYLPTTVPLATAGPSWRALGAGLGAVASGAAAVTGLNALHSSMTRAPAPLPASEPMFAPTTPQAQDLVQALKTHLHLAPAGELSSTWEKLMAMQADAARTGNAHVPLAEVIALLREDFGPALQPLADLVVPTTDEDFAEFDAPQHASGRHRRELKAQAGTGTQASEEALAEAVSKLLEQSSSSALRQDELFQLEVLREQWRSLPAGHWLLKASTEEQALWLTLRQNLASGYQRLGELGYDSPARFEAQRPALEQALAAAGESELKLAVLQSKLMGYLSGGPQIPGLEVMTAALNDDPQVEVGSLHLSIGQGADAVSLALPRWLVFIRRDASGADAGVVLYRPEKGLAQVFTTQQQMYEYLDVRRLRQALQAEVQPPPTPGPAARRSAWPGAADPAPGSLPELALETALPSQRAALRRTLDELGQRADLWTAQSLQVRPYPGTGLRAKFEHRAEAQLDQEQARLQRLAANPGLASQSAAAARAAQQAAAFIDENLPTLRAVTRSKQSLRLTESLQAMGALAPEARVDADAVQITFNGQTMNWTDWVLEGYRQHGDNVIAASNNFLADARFEHDDPAVVRALSRPDVKQGVQQHLRSTYAGDQYIEYLQQWLAPDDPRGQQWRDLRSQQVRQELLVTLEQARVDKAIPTDTLQAFRTLVDGLDTRTFTDEASLQALRINGRRIPETLVLSLSQRAQGQRFSPALRSDYVFLHTSDGPQLLELSHYKELIRNPGKSQDDLLARTLLKDKESVDAVLRGQRDTGGDTEAISDFARYVGDQWIRDGIDNIREASTGRHEMMVEQVLKGMNGGAAVICMAGSLGIATVSCAALTLGLMGQDIGSALHNLERGRHVEALKDVASLWLDAFDVGAGLHAMNLDLLRRWVGKPYFGSSAELGQDAQSLLVQLGTDFTANGRLNDALARSDVSREQLTALSQRPGKAAAGTFYSHDGRHYIQDRYQDQVRVYEVYSDNAWATVRVRNPQRPHAQGAPVHFQDGHWRAETGVGLAGGGPVASTLKRPGERAYMQQFNFDDSSEARDIKNQLRQAFRTHNPPPLAAEDYLIAKDKWRVFGLAGVAPSTWNVPANAIIDVPQLDWFDFSTAPPGHTLKEWFMYDWRYSRRAQTGSGGYPDWAIDYVKPQFMLDLYPAWKLLSVNKKFPGESAARAYAREFDILDESSRNQLITRLMQGQDIPDLIEQFPEGARLAAKVQALVGSHNFDNERAVRTYLKNFSFPKTVDGEVLRMALLSNQLTKGRTPAWAGDYLKLESWKHYKNSPVETYKQRQDALSSWTVEAGIFESKSAADEYFEHFRIGRMGYNWDVREELALEKLFNPKSRAAWAFNNAQQSSRMKLYTSEDIPADLREFIVELGEGCERHIRLPEEMPNLEHLNIQVRVGVPNESQFMVTLPRQTPHLQHLKLKNVRLPHPSLQLDKKVMPELEALSITGCSETRLIDLGGMSHLKDIDISLNAKLSDLRMPEQLPRAESLRFSNNPDLSLVAKHIPRELPKLRKLLLEDNNLRGDLSVIVGLHAPNLLHLDLSGNHLHDFIPLSGFEHLSRLELAWNDFTTIPPSIMDLGPRVNVNLLNNRFSDRMQRRYEDDMAAAGYSGPTVRFVEHDDSAIRLARPLGEAVSAWFPADEGEKLKRLWLTYAREEYAPQFSAFLDRLHKSRSSDSAVFKKEVPTWLNKLSIDDDLRHQTFLKADLATTTCDDKVSLVYNQMQELTLLSEVTRGDFDNTPGALRLKLRDLFRLQELDKFAQIFINKSIHKRAYIDEVEVYLALREQLRNDLDLPGKTSNMLYLPSSGLEKADFAEAKAYVLKNEKRKEGGLDSYLLNSEAVRAVLKRQFPQEYERVSEQLNEVILDTETGRYAEVRARMLKNRGLSAENSDADIQRNIDPAVMEAFYKEFYGPLIAKFFKPAR